MDRPIWSLRLLLAKPANQCAILFWPGLARRPGATGALESQTEQTMVVVKKNSNDYETNKLISIKRQPIQIRFKSRQTAKNSDYVSTFHEYALYAASAHAAVCHHVPPAQVSKF